MNFTIMILENFKKALTDKNKINESLKNNFLKITKTISKISETIEKKAIGKEK